MNQYNSYKQNILSGNISVLMCVLRDVELMICSLVSWLVQIWMRVNHTGFCDADWFHLPLRIFISNSNRRWGAFKHIHTHIFIEVDIVLTSKESKLKACLQRNVKTEQNLISKGSIKYWNTIKNIEIQS